MTAVRADSGYNSFIFKLFIRWPLHKLDLKVIITKRQKLQRIVLDVGWQLEFKSVGTKIRLMSD